MANRFWVGGSAVWNSSTARWSATSGGASGASVPTSADDVFFDAASGTVTATLGADVSVLSLNCTGFTGNIDTFDGADFVYNITVGNGNTTFSPTMGWLNGGTLFLNASTTQTLTMNGLAFVAPITKSGTGTIDLQDDLNCFQLFLNAGTLNFNNHSVIAFETLQSLTANTRVLNMGSNTIRVNGFTGWRVNNTGLTINAGTSTIELVAPANAEATNNFFGAGFTYNNLLITGTGLGKVNITGANTFNNITDIGTSAHTIIFASGVTQTVGSFNVNGTVGNLVNIMSATSGAIATGHVSVPGAGYNSGDTGAIAGGSPNATFTINSVDGGGGITAITVNTPGAAYFVGVAYVLGASDGGGAQFVVDSVVPGTQFTLSDPSGINSAAYLRIVDSAAIGGATWYAGVTSVNGGNNTGWIFTDPPPPPPVPVISNMFMVM